MSDFSVIYQTSDALGPIRVLDNGESRILAFGDNDEQSKLNKKTPHVPKHSYVQVMLESLMFSSPKSAIVLGLGGGALVHALRRFDGALKLTAVELRGEVIDIAKKYFYLPIGKKLNLVEADAAVFVSDADHKKVDIIFADLYGAEGVDAKQLTDSFIQGCVRLLKPGGMLVLNCWKEHRQRTDVRDQLQQHFCDVYASLSSGGNWVIFAALTPGVLKEEGLKQARAELSTRLEFNVGKASLGFGPWAD
ncbi:spermidine synthase [Shewanella litorisediminis]|uniref:Methyltransferase domain-containing protein n=1 Tax=Shewanella litorisediminis TaxID=1173586 RepID=A0ABX7G551_9GAMM|nr:methyltransferase domain-containing protein [Shewanella litorisediminis]MCL2917948.1 methyltransferase domain-containing protein [Shewanella litorisediminis]QRH02382.1 methyltransferase domain-containing protein [Shewanella litorisediminis]